MRNTRLDELQAGIKICGRNIHNLRYVDDTTLIAESKEELKSFLMRAKEESERTGLKVNIKLRSWIWPHWFMANRGDKTEVVTDFLPFLGLEDDCGWWLQPWNRKTIASWQENCDKLRQYVRKQRHYSANKGPRNQGCGLSSGHVRSWELDGKEDRVRKNWCLWTEVLEQILESPLDSKESKPVNLKGHQPWIFTGSADAAAEALIFWSSDANRWLTEKVPDAVKDWGQKEKRASEEEMAGWHHWCNGHELGQTSGEGKRQGGPACCSPWGCKESDTTGRLNNNKIFSIYLSYLNL